jgi:hypothetical protein
MLVALSSAYAMYWYGTSITGPFIFGDEVEYFLFGHDLFAGVDFSEHTQYGIVYPAVLAFFFQLGDTVRVYEAARVFNVAICASSAIPSFLFARALLPGNGVLWGFLALFSATSAFSGLSDLVWAEPLYFTLFQWSVFSLFLFYRRPQIIVGCITGVLLGLLFNTKPGAGIVVQVAAVFSLLALLGDKSWHPPRSTVLGGTLAAVLACAAITIPWVVRNLELGVGPIGYDGHNEELRRLFAEIGALPIAGLAFRSAFYQLSYLFFATWGLLSVAAIISLFRWKTLPTALRGIITFMAVCITGMIAFLSLGMRSDSNYEYWMPFGRYLSVLSPTIVILCLSLLKFYPVVERPEKLYLIAGTVLLGALTAWATPLIAIIPRSIVDAPDLALVMDIVDKGQLISRPGYDPTFLQRAGFGALFVAFALTAIVAANRRNGLYGFVGLILSASLVVSLAEHYYITTLGTSQSPTNDAIRFLRGKGVDFERAVSIDRSLEKSAIRFMIAFWNTSWFPLHYLAAGELDQHIHDWNLKYFVTPEVLAFPVAFHAPGIYVYLLEDSVGQSGRSATNDIEEF